MEATKTCKNCGHILTGSQYCGECGQKIINERITVRHLFQYLLATLTNLDRGLWYTILEMIKRPGKVITEFINGRTRDYYHPIRFAFLMGTISFLILLGLDKFDATQESMQQLFSPNADEDNLALQRAINERLKPFLNLFPLLMIPFYSLGSYWFYKKKALNYAEHMVLHAYNYGIVTLIGLPLMLTYATLNQLQLGPVLGFGLTSIYLAYIFKRIFQEKWIIGFLKGFLSLLIGYLAFMLIIGVLALIIGLTVGIIQNLL